MNDQYIPNVYICPSTIDKALPTSKRPPGTGMQNVQTFILPCKSNCCVEEAQVSLVYKESEHASEILIMNPLTTFIMPRTQPECLPIITECIQCMKQHLTGFYHKLPTQLVQPGTYDSGNQQSQITNQVVNKTHCRHNIQTKITSQ